MSTALQIAITLVFVTFSIVVLVAVLARIERIKLNEVDDE